MGLGPIWLGPFMGVRGQGGADGTRGQYIFIYFLKQNEEALFFVIPYMVIFLHFINLFSAYYSFYLGIFPVHAIFEKRVFSSGYRSN